MYQLCRLNTFNLRYLCRKLAKAVIETDQWPLALRGTYKRHEKETTAFRELIAKMPGIIYKIRFSLDYPNPDDPKS